MAVDVFDLRADQYESKFMDVALYHATLDLFCNAIAKKDPAILELACGPGNITKYLLSKRPDFRLLGTDLSPNMLALARKNNPSATFALQDCREINRMEFEFDGIMCGFGLPYLSKEEAVKLIADAAHLLLPGGILYLSTMEGDYGTSGIQTSNSGDTLYMHFHEATYLQQALKDNGFSIVDARRIEYPPEGGLTTDLVILARLGTIK